MADIHARKRTGLSQGKRDEEAVMRKTIIWTLSVLSTCALLGLVSVKAQPADYGAKPGASDEPKQYIVVTSDLLQRAPAQYEGQYVQVKDTFFRMVDRFPRELTRYGIVGKTHFGFRTHKVVGSNMICFVRRDDADAHAFFQTPLVNETPIYLMGRVGPQVDTGEGFASLFLVDRIVRGHEAPPAAPQKKKPLQFTIEWQTERGMQKQEYVIPEPGKRYVIPDPYDRTRNMYMTFQF